MDREKLEELLISAALDLIVGLLLLAAERL